jgi:hypothetical protein
LAPTVDAWFTTFKEDTMRRLAFTLAAFLAGPLVIGPAATSAAAANEPVQLTFDKTASGPGTWSGTVSGDVNGDLTTTLLSVTETGVIWHVTFDWVVDGDASFTARLSGTLNTSTGHVVMNGRVIDGAYLGAEVHEEGQLVDAATLRFRGSIRIMPATGGS